MSTNAQLQPWGLTQRLDALDVAVMTRGELIELYGAIGFLIDARPSNLCEVLDLDDAREKREAAQPTPSTSRAGGWIEHQYKSSGGKRYGPYEYECWREGGKKKSRYLGRVKS